MELTKNPYNLQVEKHYPRYAAFLVDDRIVIRGYPMWGGFSSGTGDVAMVLPGKRMKSSSMVVFRLWAGISSDKTATYYMGLVEGQLSLRTYKKKNKANPPTYYIVNELLVSDPGGIITVHNSAFASPTLV